MHKGNPPKGNSHRRGGPAFIVRTKPTEEENQFSQDGNEGMAGSVGRPSGEREGRLGKGLVEGGREREEKALEKTS